MGENKKIQINFTILKKYAIIQPMLHGVFFLFSMYYIMKDIRYVKIIWIIYPNQAIFFDAIRH